jgi:hypothetical protein
MQCQTEWDLCQYQKLLLRETYSNTQKRFFQYMPTTQKPILTGYVRRAYETCRLNLLECLEQSLIRHEAYTSHQVGIKYLCGFFPIGIRAYIV